MFNKQNFLIHKFAGKAGGVRPEISGVFISPTETVATDSLVLLKVDTLEPKENFKSFIIAGEEAKQVSKFPEGYFSSLELSKIKQMTRVEGEYPKYQPILQEQGKYISISINPKMLADVAKFFSDFVSKQFPVVELRIPVEEDKAVKIVGKNDKQKAVALIMPIKA